MGRLRETVIVSASGPVGPLVFYSCGDKCHRQLMYFCRECVANHEKGLKIMDNYEVQGKLGIGACGSVYLVKHKELKKYFALKKIYLDESRKTRTKDAVSKEVSILGRLKHPHIVLLHESFFDDREEHLYIVQDYCDGGSLTDKIITNRQEDRLFEEKQIMHWFVQILMAVQYMHSVKILHRDLKAENVFLTKKNVVKIGDFGISKMLDATMDLAQTVVGTPTYLSPELCQDIPYSSKSDIWALGCLLYEMCTLKPPFDAQNLISLFFKIVKADYESLSTENFSQPLVSLVDNLLLKNPDDRPSASAVLNYPFVKEHLSVFIKDTEQLILLKAIKDTSNRESPDLLHPGNLTPNRLSPSVDKSPNTSRKRKTVASHDLKTVFSKDSGFSSNTAANAVEVPSSKENVDDSDYSDDFDESSESEIEEEICEEPSIGKSDEESCEVEYADDFEDSDEELGQVVNQAKEARDLEIENEYFEEEIFENDGNNPLSYLKNQCMKNLGNDDLNKMSEILGKTGYREENHDLCVGQDRLQVTKFDGT